MKACGIPATSGKVLPMRKAFMVVAVTAIIASGGFAAPKKAPAKPIDVYTCPITGEKSKGDAGGSEVVGKYKVHFCCAGCQPALDKLSAKEKTAKVEAAAKKDKGGKS
jgi:hypothetical protein